MFQAKAGSFHTYNPYIFIFDKPGKHPDCITAAADTGNDHAG